MTITQGHNIGARGIFPVNKYRTALEMGMTEGFEHPRLINS